MTMNNFIEMYNKTSGVPYTFPGCYKYSATYIDKQINLACSVIHKPNSTGFRSLDPWFMFFLDSLLQNYSEGSVAKICVEFKYDERRPFHIESLGRRLSYLAINNDWDFELKNNEGEIVKICQKENIKFKKNDNEIIKPSYPKRKDNREGSIEKDFQTFIFGNSKALKQNKANSNERLAIFGEDFYKLKGKNYPIEREFPISSFDGQVSEACRILPPYSIDFVTVNKTKNLSIIEFKLNDEKMDSMAQILDYALFVFFHKDDVVKVLKNMNPNFDTKLKDKFSCYIANNHFHPKFSAIEKYYFPKKKEFNFEFKKIHLGSTSVFKL